MSLYNNHSYTNTMAAESDFSAIDNLLKINHDNDLPAFASSQWLRCADRNQGSYSANVIQIDMESALQNWVVWSDAYIAIPIIVQSSNSATPYTASAIQSLAFKDGGAVNLISGVQVMNQETTIFNSNSGADWYRNQIRMALETSADSLNSTSADAGYYPMRDDYSGSDCIAAAATGLANGGSYGLNATPFTGAVNAAVDNGATISTSIRNPTYNKAFEDSTRWLQSQLTYLGNGQFGGTVQVRFCDIHPFFHTLDMPLKGFWLRMQLYLNFLQFAPMVAANGLAAPKISVGSNGLGQTACQIYYRAVQAGPGLKQRLDAKLRAGFSRDLSFLLTDNFGVMSYNNTSTQLNQLVNASVIAPQRLWVLTPASGAAMSSTAFSPIQGCGSLSNVQVLVGDRTYFSNPLLYSDEFFNQVKEAMASSVTGGKSGVVNYLSWKGARRMYPLTLSRLEDDRGLTTPVTVQLQAQRTDTTSNSTGTAPAAIDLVLLTDRLQNCRIHCDETGVKVVSVTSVAPK